MSIPCDKTFLLVPSSKKVTVLEKMAVSVSQTQLFSFDFTNPHSRVGRALDLKTEGCGFDPQLANLTITHCLLDETLSQGPV